MCFHTFELFSPLVENIRINVIPVKVKVIESSFGSFVFVIYPAKIKMRFCFVSFVTLLWKFCRRVNKPLAAAPNEL